MFPYNFVYMFNPLIPNLNKLALVNNDPPTIYSLLESYVNYEKPDNEKVKIKDLANAGRSMFFDFEYPLSEHVTKATFETMILNHYITRRIGYETVTAFKLALQVKLNEIMPQYNKLFDAIDGWNLFESGETVTRNVIDNRITNSTNTATNTSDQRFSDTPQNQLDDVRDGKYVSQYSYNTDTANNTGNMNDNGITNETISRTPADKLALYQQFLKNNQNIYTMIFKDLDVLFYQLA